MCHLVDPASSSVQGRFAAVVARDPGAVSVNWAGGQVDYATLDRAANRLAHRLIRLGVRPESRVAILQERTTDLLVSMLAVVKAGASYVPLHNGHPPARHRAVVADAEPVVLLLDRVGAERRFDHCAQVIVVDDEEALPAEAAWDPGVASHPAAALCVLYTSGSTGGPKGVELTHGAVLDLVRDPWWSQSPHRAALFHAPHAFDVSIYEVWIPLLNGARIVLAPPQPIDGALLGSLVADNSLRAVHLIAGLFDAVAEEAPEAFSALQEVITGGDVISPTAVRRVLEACPGIRVRHQYGPTETTLYATEGIVTGSWDSARPLPLGRARPGVRTYVLDRALQPVGVGVAGELFLAGSGVARGYLNRPALTAERFLPDPYGPAGSRMYRTGDIVRTGGDGALQFVARADDQVKIRGYRVEPAEVEAAIGAQPGVSRAVVVVAGDGHGGKQLVAFAVPEQGTALSARAIRMRVAEVLPEYMTPGLVRIVPTLPLTPNGKVDRSALAELVA